MANTVVTFAELLGAFGFDWALVRHPDPTTAHYNSAWTLRVLLGLATALILLCVAPLAATFYMQPAVQPLLTVMALSTFLGSLENIGTVDFRRHFAFDREFVLRSGPKLVSFLIALTIAISLHSYWALVIGTLASRLTGTMMSFAMHPFRPRFSLKASAELLSFSIWLLASNVLEFARTRFADLFVGRAFGPRATGLYSVANEIAHLSTSELAAPINRAAFSMYAKNAMNPAAIRDGFLSVASVIWLVALPMAAGTVAVSREIVAILLGPQWSDASGILSLLAVGGGLSVMMANTHYVYWALGRSRIVTALAAFGLIAMVTLALVLSHFLGLPGVAIGYVLAAGLTIPVNYYLLWKTVGIPFSALWRLVWRSCLAALMMWLTLMTVFTASSVTTASAAIAPLLLKMLTGTVLYAGYLWAIWTMCGKPDGAERTTLRLGSRKLSILRHLL
jgi:O-antigen/teichoic acid export membrane protein